MAKFDLDKYEPVDARVGRFWFDHPDGAIRTRIVQYPYGASDSWVVRARVYVDGRCVADGHAEETPGEGMVNRTSALENCETSAIGRALANAGYSPHKGERASREEMELVEAAQQRMIQATGQAKAMADKLTDHTEWDKWKADHRHWHRTESGLRDAMTKLGEILAGQGVEPWEADNDE